MNAYLETRTYATGFPVSAFYRQNNTFRAHWHLEVELAYVLEGSIFVCINREAKEIREGELAVIRSGDIHYYDSTGLSSRILVLIFRPELIGSPGGWPEGLAFSEPFLTLRGSEIRQEIEETMHRIAAELAGKRAYSRPYITGRLQQLCALLLRHYPTREAPPENGGRLSGMQSAIEYIEQNYCGELQLADAAEKAHLSECYFSRLFSKYTGYSFHAYLNKLRVERAEKLLKTGEESVLAVSMACGFNSIRTFNRVYKALKGVAPSEDRPQA